MDYNSEYSSAAAAGLGAGTVFFCLIVLVIVYAGLWKTFVKAGKPGWAAIIPIYNLIVLIEIVGKPTIWILWLLIPCVNIVFSVWLMNLLSKSFGKTEGFTVGLIILPIVFYPILGFGDAKYLGPSAAEAQNGFNNPNNPFGNNNPFNDPFNKPPTTPGI
ncbi:MULTISPECIES: DUF5684 domain-containing protein [Pedobacter]|jgi:hypothetical protein|uniref:DUF5684 domain-containing protein n=1 Tax=Pedobacter panaciterrae TaxID=363849 RepID=A0ABU8NQV2_9SPHI|nr:MULTISPECIES: DUF5684 domain-containing protein [Pedobacter]ETZ19669.1 hypothetical protein N824_09365 [Pedobacter sp. V48]NQX54994.1 hypothetical protein [Pedobacter panaciterrae]